MAQARRRARREDARADRSSSSTSSSSTACPGRFDGTVTYHDSCAGLREMGVKASAARRCWRRCPASTLDGDGRVRDLLRLRRHLLDQVRRDLGAARRQQVRAHRQRAAPTPWCWATSAACSTSKGRLRRRGDTKTQVLHVAEVLAGERSPTGPRTVRRDMTGTAMQVASMHFKERAHVKLHDARLQDNLRKMQGKFVAKRRASLVELDDFEGTRDAGKAIRNRALENLDVWLELLRAQRHRARRDRAVGARRRPTSTRWCSRSPRGTRCARSSSRSRW